MPGMNVARGNCCVDLICITGSTVVLLLDEGNACKSTASMLKLNTLSSVMQLSITECSHRQLQQITSC